MLSVGEFARIKEDFPEAGLTAGEVVYVAGDNFLPISEEDPYIFRRLLVVAKMEEGHIQPDLGGFMVDGQRFESLSDEENNFFLDIYQADFDIEVEEEQSETTH